MVASLLIPSGRTLDDAGGRRSSYVLASTASTIRACHQRATFRIHDMSNAIAQRLDEHPESNKLR